MIYLNFSFSLLNFSLCYLPAPPPVNAPTAPPPNPPVTARVAPPAPVVRVVALAAAVFVAVAPVIVRITTLCPSKSPERISVDVVFDIPTVTGTCVTDCVVADVAIAKFVDEALMCRVDDPYANEDEPIAPKPLVELPYAPVEEAGLKFRVELPKFVFSTKTYFLPPMV